MDLTVILELCGLVAIGVVVAGGVQRRVKGWGLVSSLLALGGVVECVGGVIVVSNLPTYLVPPLPYNSRIQTAILYYISKARHANDIRKKTQAILVSRDPRFFPGWHLSTSFVLCIVSTALLLLTSAAILLSWLYLPAEGGYELVPDTSASVGGGSSRYGMGMEGEGRRD